jgi:hypothetical protein
MVIKLKIKLISAPYIIWMLHIYSFSLLWLLLVLYAMERHLSQKLVPMLAQYTYFILHLAGGHCQFMCVVAYP